MNTKSLPYLSCFAGAFLLQFFLLSAWGIPPGQLAVDDGSAMFVADTIHLFKAGADPVLIQGSTDDDAKIPLLLIHGIDQGKIPGRSLQDSWYNFVAFFQATPSLCDKYKLYVVAYHSNMVSVDELGDDLGTILTQLDQVTHGLNNKQFVIIAHSMGGLVSRALMKKGQTLGPNNGVPWGERVLKLITLATPHHGTPLANSTSPFGALGSALGPLSPLAAVADHYNGEVSYNEVNRSDLRWDNYDPTMLNHGSWDRSTSDRNVWLQGLNAAEAYSSRIIGYAGFINSDLTPHDGVLLGTEAVIATAANLPNDGAVPLSSAMFDKHQLAATHVETDYDHYQMCKGKGDSFAEIMAEPLFINGIANDLIAIAAKRPASFSITASSQSANGASYVQISTTAQPLAGETYTLFRDGQAYRFFDGIAFQNAQVTPGTTYSYYVQASNSVGTVTSNTVSVTVLNPVATTPAAPSALTAAAVSATQINLSWKDNSPIETGYIVERMAGSGGSYAPITGSPFPANTTACFDSGLAPETLYFYRVTATAATNSQPSNEASAITQSPSVTRVLMVNSANPGSGVHIFVSPNDVNGLADGDTSFARQYSSSVTATLVALSSWNGGAFQKWQKDGQDLTTSTVANVLMDASHTLTAVYAAAQGGTGYTITVGAFPSNGGTVSGGGSYGLNSQVSIQATAAPGFTFLNWTTNASGQNGGTTFAVQPQVGFSATANLSLVANFTQNTSTDYVITTTADPANGGTATGGGTYPASSNVTLSAQPATGYVFDSWTENGVFVTYAQSFEYQQVSKPHNFVAHFHVPAAGSVPDLFPTKFTLDQKITFSGARMNQSTAVKDVGNAASKPFAMYLVLSESATVPPSGNIDSLPGRLVSQGFGAGLPIGVEGGSNGSFLFRFQDGSTVPPGDYYVWMMVDPENSGGEPLSNRGNNNLVLPITVLPPPANDGADLVAENFALSPGVTFPAGTLFVNGRIRNVGNAASTAAKYYVSISTSGAIAPDRNALGVSGAVPNLGIYGDSALLSTFALPNNLTAGNYYVWVMLDPEAASGEPVANRANDNIVLPLTIAEPPQAYTINVSSSSGADGSVSGGGTYVSGALVPVVATPAGGMVFSGWSDGGVIVSSEATYTFPAATDRTLVAGFVTGITVAPSAGNNGSIDPNASQLIAPGRALSFSAVPSTGFQVDEWLVNGAVAQRGGTAFTLSNITTEAAVQVTFKPFPPISTYKGSYRGLINGTVLSNGRSGKLSLTLSTNGAFSTSVLLGRKSYSLKGTFDESHNALISIPGATTKLLIQMVGSDQSDQLTGTAVDGNAVVANLRAERTVVGFGIKKPAPYAGRYTLSLPVEQAHLNEATFPQGNGYGSLIVAATGAASFTGGAGDGTVLRGNGLMTTRGAVPLFFPLYGGSGFMSGWLSLHDAGAARQVDGTLEWYKPATLNAAFYPAGFSGETTVDGSTYVPPPTQPQTLPAGAATFTIIGGNIAVSPAKALTIDAANKVKIVGNEKFTFTLAPKTGLFSGTFLDSGKASRTFKGAVLQKQNVGVGLFKGDGQTGMVELSR